MGGEAQRPAPDRIERLAPQTITLTDFQAVAGRTGRDRLRNLLELRKP